MSKLIDLFGGYDEAKHFLKNDEMLNLIGKTMYKDTFIIYDRLNIALLNYRIDNNIFEVCDYVFITQKVWGEEPWDDMCYIFSINPDSPLPYHIVGADGVDISIGFTTKSAFRHATLNEIRNRKKDEH